MKNEKIKKGKTEAKESKEIKVNDKGVVNTAKEDFKKFIEKHRLQNPVKYEINKAQLEKQLSEIE